MEIAEPMVCPHGENPESCLSCRGYCRACGKKFLDAEDWYWAELRNTTAVRIFSELKEFTDQKKAVEESIRRATALVEELRKRK